MSIAITDEQRAVLESIRDWATRAGTVAMVRDGATTLPGGLAELGIFAMTAPDEEGGVVDLAVALEQAAASLVPGPVLGTALAGLLLADRPDSPVAKELLPAVAAGRTTVAVALSTGTFTVEDDRLHGTVGPVPGAAEADHLLLGAAPGTWFVLDRSTATLSGRTPVDISRPLADVELIDVPLPSSRVLPDLTTGRVLDLAVTLASAEAAGIAGWCLRTAAEYAKVREQFGQPIGSFQAVKHLCARMLCRVEQATVLAWDAARAADEAPDEHPFVAAAAGAFVLDAAVETAKDCIQVLGGIGFTWEHDAHLYLRRALSLRQLLGGGARWRRRTAELALDGARRRLGVDVTGVDRSRIQATARDIAASQEQRIALADSGFLAPHWPKPYGLGASATEQVVIDEELRAAGVRRPDLVIGGWAVPTILGHGSDAQRERFVRPTLRGEITWCQLFSEPGAGSDLASLRTRAVRTDGGWLLSGQKVWTSVATEADWAICLARTDAEAPKHKGITYFVVDMRTPGIDIRPLREITGDAVFNEVFLDDVFVPDELVVGEVNGGWKLARTTLANERVAMSGGSSLGEGMEALLDTARRSGLADDPVVRDRLGTLVTEALAGSLLDLRTTLRSLGGQQPGPESAVRKLVGVEHRQALAETALELHGPAGATNDGDLAPVVHELLLTRCLSIAGGTTQILLSVAAERVLGLPR